MINKHVLLVDDDEDLLTLLQWVLKTKSYEVSTAEDGLVALDRLAQFTPDLILLDLMMPRMDGYAFMAELQRRGLRPDIPVVILSADINARDQVKHMGIESFLSKPYDLPVLLATVARLVPLSPLS
ncbi:MAG TPA: response regulator [Ktedonobacteraceae bacterium]|nr:response regulator [Ktedonobacteraceae bacterium]